MDVITFSCPHFSNISEMYPFAKNWPYDHSVSCDVQSGVPEIVRFKLNITCTPLWKSNGTIFLEKNLS